MLKDRNKTSRCHLSVLSFFSIICVKLYLIGKILFELDRICIDLFLESLFYSFYDLLFSKYEFKPYI